MTSKNKNYMDNVLSVSFKIQTLIQEVCNESTSDEAKSFALHLLLMINRETQIKTDLYIKASMFAERDN